ncbi:hypothetical protein ACTWPT_40870 [Nonomuraea sp. 3N208]|uniref:hypothetical protein n=1 Tax=Nonomuraea sp. 3N208 TaxID=3457421 RepID=UPI003FD25CFF
MEIRKTVLEGAVTDVGEVAIEVRAAFDELLAAVSAVGSLPQNDDISAMISAACAAIHEIAAESVESAVTALGEHGEGLVSMAAAYEAAEQDSILAIRSGTWA